VVASGQGVRVENRREVVRVPEKVLGAPKRRRECARLSGWNERWSGRPRPVAGE
jgi:hypothetical protein